MKIFLSIFGVVTLQIIFGACDENLTVINYEQCLRESNVDLDFILKNINPDGLVNEGISSIDDVTLCYYKKEQFLNADNNLDVDKFKHHLVDVFFKFSNMTFDQPEEVAINAIKLCKDVEGSDAGDTLIKGYNCRIRYFNEQKNKL